MTNRLTLLFILALTLCGALLTGDAAPLQAQNPAPTLIPPTLVPAPESADSESLLPESGIARIINSGRVRVGILYNEPPFGEFNLRGEHIGFDADLAKAIAETWGVELRFKQVTRQTAQEMLRQRDVDMLIAAQVHRRNLDTEFEFSQTYYMDSQSVLVQNTEGSPRSLPELANRRVAVTQATDSEVSLNEWMARTQTPLNVQPYPTLELAYNALMNGEVEALVARRYQIARITTQPDLILILDDPIELEPYAIAMPRQDVNLRNLVNQTLQHLRAKGKLAEIRQVYFPESSYLPALWAGLSDEPPKPDQFTTAVTYPAQYIVPRLQSERVLRVALETLPPDSTESRLRRDSFHRALIDELARRWGVQVQHLTVDDPAQALELVANGQADLAVGVQPSWDWDERVDFTSPYMLHGLRLLVKQNSNIFGFEELRGGRYVAYPVERPELEQAAVAHANQASANIRTFGSRETDFAEQLLESNNADVAFADSIALLPFVEQYAGTLQLTKRWYSEEYQVMATPRNDIDFRLLTEYTQQELVRDGTLARLLAPVMLPEDIPTFDIWPGTGHSFGLNIGG